MRSVLHGRRSSSPAQPVRRSRTGWAAPTLIVGHRADHRRAALHLLADELRRSLTRRAHSASLSRRADAHSAGKRSSRTSIPQGYRCYRDRSTSVSFPGRRGRATGKKIRCVGAENLTGDDITRTLDGSTDLTAVKRMDPSGVSASSALARTSKEFRGRYTRSQSHAPPLASSHRSRPPTQGLSQSSLLQL